jgi:hypothetical protein
MFTAEGCPHFRKGKVYQLWTIKGTVATGRHAVPDAGGGVGTAVVPPRGRLTRRRHHRACRRIRNTDDAHCNGGWDGRKASGNASSACRWCRRSVRCPAPTVKRDGVGQAPRVPSERTHWH